LKSSPYPSSELLRNGSSTSCQTAESGHCLRGGRVVQQMARSGCTSSSVKLRDHVQLLQSHPDQHQLSIPDSTNHLDNLASAGPVSPSIFINCDKSIDKSLTINLSRRSEPLFSQIWQLLQQLIMACREQKEPSGRGPADQFGFRRELNPGPLAKLLRLLP